MAYEYEIEISSLIIDNPSEIDGYAHDELKEVYRKAKVFDEILAIHNMDEEYEDTIGNYEQYIDKLVKKYLEGE